VTMASIAEGLGICLEKRLKKIYIFTIFTCYHTGMSFKALICEKFESIENFDSALGLSKDRYVIVKIRMSVNPLLALASRVLYDKAFLDMHDIIRDLSERLEVYEPRSNRYVFGTDSEMDNWYSSVYSQLWDSIKTVINRSSLIHYQSHGSLNLDDGFVEKTIIDVINSDHVLTAVKARHQRIINPWLKMVDACTNEMRKQGEKFDTDEDLRSRVESVFSDTFDDSAGEYLLALVDSCE